MKKIYLFLLLAALGSSLMAQPKLNAPGNYFLMKLQEQPIPERPDAQFIQDYDLVSIEGHYCIGVLGMVDEDTIDEAALEALGVRTSTRLNHIWTFRVPLSQMQAFLEVPGLLYLEIAEPVSPFLPNNVRDSRADSVHLGLGGLDQAYKGSGVVIGVIDWGFDYRHPTFYDDQLNELRLVRAWDQNKIVGTPPSGFDFGAEYASMEELLIAKHDTDYVFGPGSHGTHVAGIAGGAGGGPDAIFDITASGNDRIIGAAPEAELIFISLRRDAPSLIDGFNYVRNYAESVGKPFVINMSFGSHLGPHDGMDLKNVGIDQIAGPGRVFVGSGGNNGTGAFHLERNFNTMPDTLRSVVTQHFASDWGQTLSMWGSANSSFKAAIALIAGGQEVFRTPFFDSSEEPQLEEIFNQGNGELHIRVQSTAAFTTNDKPNIRLEVRNTTGFGTLLIAISDDSHLHIWNNARMQNRYTNWGADLSSAFPGASMGNVEYAVGEPGGCGKSVITVGSHRARVQLLNGNWIFGGISAFSSAGPTVDGRNKPDITGGGSDVWSAVNSYAEVGSHPIEFEGNTYTFDQFSGTSMSGPLVAGIVALMLQANPELTAMEAREVIRATAIVDEFTGEIGPEGDLRWGWGKINALAAVLGAQTVTGTDNAVIDNNYLKAWPNPTTGMLMMELPETLQGTAQMRVFDLSGKLLMQEQFNTNGSTFSTDISHLPNGVYLLSFEANGKHSFTKVVRQ